VSRGPGSRGPAVAPCTAAGLARTARLAATAFTLARCGDGWALAAGLNGTAGDIGIFLLERGRWADDPGFGPTRLSAVSPVQFATAGISPPILLRLAAPFPQRVRQVTGAGALVEELAARETRLGVPGSYRVSQVLRAGDATWLILVGAGSAPAASPDLDSTLQVYRWSAAGWSDQGTVTGSMGPISPGCCGISAGFQTGSHDPDFTMIGGGAADTNWLSVVTDASGHWRLATFDYGYTDSTVVNGWPASRGVATEVDATGSAGGPTTWLFETYQRGEFQPADSPGPRPSCGLPALQAAAGHGVQFTASACADGWALAVGSRAGQRGQVAGLFNALGPRWIVVEMDSGTGLGSDPGIYDIPLSLLRQLAAHFGPTFRPEIAIAPLIASPALAGWSYVSGVITAGDALWFVAEEPEGSLATAILYRWSGSRWLPQGTVNRVPASLDYYMLPGNPDGGIAYGRFEAVTVSGTAEPGFVLQGSGASHPDVLTDAGGRWHAARYR
jgi:hypothetical protein